jgi:hypothetical protein
LASIATDGSFCLFCENGVVGLPTVTRASGLNAAAFPAPINNAPATSTGTATSLPILTPSCLDDRDREQFTPGRPGSNLAGQSAAIA